MSKKDAPMYSASKCHKEGETSNMFAVSDCPRKLISLIHSASGMDLECKTNPNSGCNENAWTLGKKVNEYGDAIGYPCYSVSPVLLIK